LKQQALACFVSVDTDLGSVDELPICRPADLPKSLTRVGRCRLTWATIFVTKRSKGAHNWAGDVEWRERLGCQRRRNFCL